MNLKRTLQNDLYLVRTSDIRRKSIGIKRDEAAMSVPGVVGDTLERQVRVISKDNPQ